MEDYLAKLFLSPLPVSLGVLAVLWLVVHCTSLALALHSLRFSAAEQHIVIPDEAQPKLTPRMVGFQTVLAMAVFAYAFFAGGALASVFAGGWFIAATLGLALNARNALLVHARTSPGGVSGRAVISVDAALKERAADLWAGVILCILVAIVVPHPAFLGAAWILGSGAAGLARRARRASGAAAA
jgi:hypothetical protein